MHETEPPREGPVAQISGRRSRGRRMGRWGQDDDDMTREKGGFKREHAARGNVAVVYGVAKATRAEGFCVVLLGDYLALRRECESGERDAGELGPR
jgi:hypothetical protein